MRINLKTEIRKTSPDYIVYAPKKLQGGGDTGNEHFMVFEGPDGKLKALWTQSSFEGQADQHVVFAVSGDGGRTWTPPRTLAGPAGHAGMASWQFPLVSRGGRIYVLFSRHVGINDVFTHTTGVMAGIYSDDLGKSWSSEQVVPMPRSKWDNPDPSVPANWIVWQKPLRLSEGKYLAGFTRWVSPKVRRPAPLPVWWAEASVVEFMRFENVDDDVEVADLKISYFARNDRAVRVALPGHDDVSVVQEPAIVPLPDGRLFCVMRTAAGCPYYVTSRTAGRTWSSPRALRQTDARLPLPHPCSPCPIYVIGEGEYVFLFHNHAGRFGGWGPEQSSMHRRPIWLCRGLFRPKARQPVWFSEPVMLMDHGGVSLLRGDLAMYASTTPTRDGLVLWYPDRKFFLLGRRITRKTLASMPVPE